MADENVSEKEEAPKEEPKGSEQTENKPKDDGVPAEVKAALRKANKEAENLRLKLKEFEDRDKTESQKLADAKAEAERDAVKARTDYLRLKVGTSKGLAPELADRLQGDSEEEMVADADRLLAVLKPKMGFSGFDPGARTTASSGEDMNARIRQAAGRA